DFELFSNYYNVNEYGLWEEEKYVLNRKVDKTTFLKENSLNVADLDAKIETWKEKLLKERSKRVRPGLDSKALASWNGFMIKGYVDAYKAFGDKTYLAAAEKAMKFI